MQECGVHMLPTKIDIKCSIFSRYPILRLFSIYNDWKRKVRLIKIHSIIFRQSENKLHDSMVIQRFGASNDSIYAKKNTIPTWICRSIPIFSLFFFWFFFRCFFWLLNALCIPNLRNESKQNKIENEKYDLTLKPGTQIQTWMHLIWPPRRHIMTIIRTHRIMRRQIIHMPHRWHRHRQRERAAVNLVMKTIVNVAAWPATAYRLGKCVTFAEQKQSWRSECHFWFLSILPFQVLGRVIQV